MKHKVGYTFAIICIVLWLPAMGTQQNTILVIGDSISSAYGMNYDKGWVQLIQNRLLDQDKDYQIINASITGDVSASGRQRISKLIERHNPSVVIIELGGNDGLRGLPIKTLRNNLQSMISDSLESGSRVLLAGMKILPNYGPSYTRAFEQVYADLASENQISLIPFVLEGIGGVEELMQPDGIHPNEKAQPIIVENVWVELIKLI